MEKRYALFLEVLRRFQAAGLLKKLVLIGSWCQHFYRSYFADLRYTPTIRTRDMDFLVPVPFRIKNKVDVEELLRDKGFVVTFSSGAGYMKLMHPELIVEFLVPEKGKGSDRPYPLPQLSMNAQPLRFLDYLLQNTIRIEAEGLNINIPLAFRVMERFLKAGFALREDIIKVQHNCRATGFWVKKSKLCNFLLIMHEHLFVFQKKSAVVPLCKSALASGDSTLLLRETGKRQSGKMLIGGGGGN